MYSYGDEKSQIFTSKGMKDFIKTRDHVLGILKISGAITMGKAMTSTTGSSWLSMAYVDHMVIMGDIIEVPRTPGMWAQDRVFVKRGE